MSTRDCTVPVPCAGAGTERERLARRMGRRLRDTMEVWLDRVRGRRELLRLSDRMLADIGLSRADIDGEAGKPFWRP